MLPHSNHFPAIFNDRTLISAEHYRCLVSNVCREPGFFHAGFPFQARSWFTWKPITFSVSSDELDQSNCSRFFAGYVDYPNTSQKSTFSGYFGGYNWAATFLSQDECYIYHRESDKESISRIIEESIDRSERITQPFKLLTPFHALITKEKYTQALTTIHAHLAAGNCYQINYTQPFFAEYSGDPWEAYQAACEKHLGDHCYYIYSGTKHVLSFSPESFLEVEQGKVITKPIKGTRPRGKTEREDAQLEKELLASEKDRAENLMIVDLLRNDLGKVCEIGSIRVDKLFDIENYEYVHHLVSTVSGRLKPHITEFDALLSCFPGGSITGAPKKMARKIIEELEPYPRNSYCGSAFCWMPGHFLSSNIAIRTFYTERGKLYGHAGGGIVIDSAPETEYQESLTKIKIFIDTFEEQFLEL